MLTYSVRVLLSPSERTLAAYRELQLTLFGPAYEAMVTRYLKVSPGQCVCLLLHH